MPVDQNGVAERQISAWTAKGNREVSELPIAVHHGLVIHRAPAFGSVVLQASISGKCRFRPQCGSDDEQDQIGFSHRVLPWVPHH